MFNTLNYLESRAIAKFKRLKLQSKLNQYAAMMGRDHPMLNFPKVNGGDVSASPKEFFSHYEAYAFWLTKKINELGNKKKILDVGNRKIINAMNSVNNDVTALVLADCEDRISNVKYFIHDIAFPLPFANESFDVFTSLASLNIAGLSRYGDKLDPYTLLNFIKELDRVMNKKSDLIISLCYGHNFLQFNNGWMFDYDTLCELFSQWNLIDYLIDNDSTPGPRPYKERFTRDLTLRSYPLGEYRVIFLHFQRG